MVWRKPFAEKASQIGKIDPNAIRWFDRLGRQHAIKDINRPAGDITSVAKDRKAPSGGKSRTREADDAAIFA
jgi:hypothetical protein